MATVKCDFRCDLTKPIKVEYLDGNMFTLDNGGNTINVYCYEGEEPATMGGSVSANVIRPDGTTVPVSGAIDGNKAYVTLPQAAYAVPGHVTIIIKVTQSTTVTTIAAIVANNMLSSTDTIVDPGTIIPSVQDLIAQIETAVGSIPADYSALLATLAADYSSSKTYAVGDYAWQAGVLKRCIVPITTAETYTAAHWTNAVLGDDLSALKSAIGDITGPNKNLLYYYPFATNGASVDFVGDNIIVTATSASTYRNGYCDIPVNGHNSMTLSYNSKSSDSQGANAASIRVGFIDSQGTITWQRYVSSSPKTYNVAGVVKVRIGLFVDQETVEIGTKSTFNKIQVEYGETATAFSKAKYDAIDRALQAEVDELEANMPLLVVDAITEIGLNKYNPNTKVVGYISNNTGNIENADYFTSDFIDVSAFTKGYAFTPKARKLLFYDENKNAITSSYHTDETPAGVISLNSAYKFIRLSWHRSSTDVMVCDATTLPPYQPYEIVAKNGVNYLNNDTKVKIQQMVGEGGKSSQIASYLNGKTIAIFGDSIMYGAGDDGNGVGDILADKYCMTLEKYCVSGSTMGVRTDNPSYTVDEVHHIAKQVRNAIAANIDPDIIILNGGTNDIGGEIPIGEMSQVYTQPSAENYFANGFETVAYLLMKNFVGVPIIYMRAHNMSSRSYQGQIDYGELGNKIAEKWGIRTVDMYKRMNTQLAEYRTAYLADYTHPNAAGYNKYYIPAIVDFVFDELVN